MTDYDWVNRNEGTKQ